ncbi:MAG: tetratricopeptide repeat protein [Acidobacteria bacterium]|nr:tetratricopeptide repeat protein [Acidobacteriota bacterium]
MKTLLLFLLIGSLTSPNDQRLYESGLAFQANQNYEQAMREFNLLLEQYPKSPFADDALLEIGRYDFQQGNVEKAQEVLNRIVSDYGQSDSADNAYLLLGRIQLQNGKADDAYNTFFHLKGAFPESDVLDQDYFYLAQISTQRSQFKKALYYLSQIYTRFSESKVFPDSLFQAAYCYYRIGEPREALKMLSAIDEAEKGKDNPMAANLTRTLLRFTLNRPYRNVKQYFQMDSPSLLEAGTNGTLFVSAKKGRFIQIISPGQNRRRNTPGDVRAFYYSKGAGLWFSTGDQLIGPSGSVPLIVDGSPLKEVTSFFLTPGLEIWAFDKSSGLTYVFSREHKLQRKLALGDVDFIKIRRDGLVFVVKNSRKLLEIRTRDGHIVRQFGNYYKIVDLAFDPLDNIYLLADKGRSLSVLTDDFKPFQTMQLLAITHQSGRFSHIAVDAGSNIYLSLTREREILKVY